MNLNIFSLFKSKKTDKSTMRTNLNVPFKEKDLAKKSGAKWDPEKKVWYAPSGSNLEAFKAWIVPASTASLNFKADSFFIAEARGSCWKCSKHPRFISIGVYPGSLLGEQLDDEELLEDEGYPSEPSLTWKDCSFYALLYYVCEISENVHRHMQALSIHYRLAYSNTTKSTYWMNHCEHCGFKQGDFMEYCEPDGSFSGDHIGPNIKKHHIDEELIIACNGCNPCTVLEDS